MSTPSGMTVHRSCLYARRYQRSGYGQRSWFTTVTSRILLIVTPANAIRRPKPTLLLAPRYANETQHWPKSSILDSRVHTQIKQRSSIPCYNSESSTPKGLLDSVCAHAGDGQPYLAGSCMQQDRRNQNQCESETFA